MVQNGIDFKDAIKDVDFEKLAEQIEAYEAPEALANGVMDDDTFISSAVATGKFVDVTNAEVVSAEESEAYARAAEKLNREVHREQTINLILAQKAAEYFEAHHFALSGRQKRRLKKEIAKAYDTGKIRFNRPKSLNK